MVHGEGSVLGASPEAIRWLDDDSSGTFQVIGLDALGDAGRSGDGHVQDWGLFHDLTDKVMQRQIQDPHSHSSVSGAQLAYLRGHVTTEIGPIGVGQKT